MYWMAGGRAHPVSPSPNEVMACMVVIRNQVGTHRKERPLLRLGEGVDDTYDLRLFLNRALDANKVGPMQG